MEEKKPLLSICIPTYNRAEYLEKSLESIINQPEFHSDDVEVVISDNCSTDNTEELCRKYVAQYSNIHYFRNEVNNHDENFPTVISEAKGMFRKLCNDTLLFNKNAIKIMLKVIKNNVSERPVLFFYNMKNRLDKKNNDVETFIKDASFWLTSITCFGVWEDDFVYSNKACDLHLWQVPFVITNVIHKKKSLIINKKLFTNQMVQKKDVSYGLFEVFYNNYLGLVKGFTQISEKIYDYLEKDLLFNFFIFWLYEYEKSISSYTIKDNEDFKKSLLNVYSGKVYFKKFIIRYSLYKSIRVLKNKVRKCQVKK